MHVLQVFDLKRQAFAGVDGLVGFAQNRHDESYSLRAWARVQGRMVSPL